MVDRNAVRVKQGANILTQLAGCDDMMAMKGRDNMNKLKVFPTIDLCVDFLISLGCEWTHEKELKLANKKHFSFNGYVVLYDKYQILA